MNGRSGWITFFLFLFLLLMIILQVLSMVQSDRLYERLNLLLERLSSSGSARAVRQLRDAERTDLPMEECPGDEGDWLIWHLSAEPRTLNPITVEGETSTRYITIGSIFERILEYDFDEAKLKPWLAESYEISEDGLEITVKLRDDICFSDGVPVTADDILFTYETIMNPGVDAATIRNYYENFREVVKIDDLTVKFVFSELYWKTFEAVGLFEVLPKHIYEFDDPEQFNKRRSNPVGSGPYVFERWNVGQEVVLRRNENYWGYKPKLEKIIFKFISNDVAALQAFLSGDLDYMEPPADQYAELATDQEFNEKSRALSYWEPSVPFFFIAWNEETSFFSDKLVRLAMTHIIDRETIKKELLKGDAKIVTGPFYIYGRQNDPNVKPWPYDPERAKELLDEAGWRDTDGDGIRDKDGKAFSFKFSYSTGLVAYEQLAKLFKDVAAQVGIEVVPDPYEWSVFVEKLQNHEFDALVIGYGGTLETDPYQIFHSSQIAGRGDNFISFRNAEADTIIEEARRAIDENKRYPLYHRLHRLLHEEQPFTFLFTRPERRFLDRRFENVIIHKLGLNPHEWYVPEELQKYK